VNNSYIQPKTRFFSDPFNYLRVVAMLCVFLLHAKTNSLNHASSSLAFLLYTPAWAGVWIFVFLSGYFLFKGFWQERYKLTGKGVGQFYLKRVLKLLPTYYVTFLFAYLLFSVGKPLNPKTVLRFMFLGYNGIGSLFTGMGALWFVSTIFQLYLLTPLFAFLLRPLKNKKSLTSIVLLFIIAAGLVYRLLSHHLNLDWYRHSYTAFYANLDIYLGAGLFALLKQQKGDSLPKQYLVSARILSCCSLLVLIATNSYVYFSQNVDMLFVYRYYLPSVYLLSCGFFAFAFDGMRREKDGKTRPIDFLAGISLEFYMVHSIMLHICKPLWTTEIMTLPIYIFYLFSMFCISLLIAWLLQKFVQLLSFGMTKLFYLIKNICKPKPHNTTE